MIDIPVTVAKLKPELWKKILGGVKRFEVRDECTEADFFVFVTPRGDVLGVARILSRFELRGERDFGAVARLADITEEEARTLFGTGDGPLYVYRVRPYACPLLEIARLADEYRAKEAAE